MGGKSRKSGGVSKKLIDRIKTGAYSTKEKGTTEIKTNEKKKKRHPSLFGLITEKGN